MSSLSLVCGSLLSPDSGLTTTIVSSLLLELTATPEKLLTMMEVLETRVRSRELSFSMSLFKRSRFLLIVAGLEDTLEGVSIASELTPLLSVVLM